MNVLELMIKAVKGTVEEGVQQVLGGLGLVQETEQAPPTARPPVTTPPPRTPPASDPKVTSFEVVDAVFPDSSSSEESSAAAGTETGVESKAGSSAQGKAGAEAKADSTKSTESPSGPVEANSANANSSAKSTTPAAGPKVTSPPPESGAKAGPKLTVEESDPVADRAAVRAVFDRRLGPLRGFEIAEETGISPWWRLKDVLKGLVDEGTLDVSDDGQYSLRRTETP